MKYAAGFSLATAGTYRAAESLGYFAPQQDGLHRYGAGAIPWPITKNRATAGAAIAVIRVRTNPQSIEFGRQRGSLSCS